VMGRIVADRLAADALEAHLAITHGLSPAVLRRCRHLAELEDHHADVAPDCGWSG
jgi:hypothetical protein